MKKVILLLVDSLMPHVLKECVSLKSAPALQFLMDHATYSSDCVTVFPTMTASVDSSLVTGEYPDRHRIPGLLWYNPDEKTIVNYINGFHCARKSGFFKCGRNALYALNERHLSKEVTTVFEELYKRGRTSASINVVVHRGPKKHRLRLHAVMDFLTLYQFRGEISGPDVLTLGAFVQGELQTSIPPEFLKAKRKYGINDDFAVAAVKELITSGTQPDFMMVYLPDNDHEVHKKNPHHSQDALLRVDRRIQDILNTFASWNEALEHNVFIVTSDHGQTNIGNGPDFTIDLDRLLARYRVLQLGEQLSDHDLALANNERMVYLYPSNPNVLAELIRLLTREARIDLIAWKENKGVRVRGAGAAAEVYFEKGGEFTDVYGNTWSICGDWKVLDLQTNDGVVNYQDYPDVLSRLYGALYSQEIPMIVLNARPRYEFKTRYFPMHSNGGCHGSLHKYDSVVPLIITGSNRPLKEPARLIDLKRYILELFDGS